MTMKIREPKDVAPQLGTIQNDKYEVIRPFSCNIVRTILEPKLVPSMQEIFTKQSENLDQETPIEVDNSYGLAGNNKREFNITEDMLDTEGVSLLTSCLADISSQHYISSIIVEWRFKKDVLTPKHVEIIEKHLENMSITVNITSVWGNISIAGDFNPPHTHSGHVSGVAYFKIPDNIEREWLLEDHDPSAGLINFWDSRLQVMSLASFKVKPVVGDLYCFPAWLNHSVWPFRSPGQRWSMSYNCEVFNKNNDLRLDDLEKAELRKERTRLLKELEDL